MKQNSTFKSTANTMLILVESIDINDSSGTKGRVSLIRNLVKLGYSIRLLHYSRKNIDLDGIECVSIKEQRLSVFYILSKFQRLIWRMFKWNINPYFEKKYGFSFSFFNDSYSIVKSINQQSLNDYNWVLTLSKGASFRTHHALLKCPEWYDKWLAYIHDPYPFHFYPRPYNWVAPGYYKQQEFMRAVSKACAFGVFPSKLLLQWMGSYFPDFLTKRLIIPHQISEDLHQAELPNYFFREGFTILHAGNLMKPRNPKGLLEGFKLFLKNNPEAQKESQLIFIGKMDYFMSYLKNEKVTLEQLYISDGYVDFKEVNAMQNAACINVILEAKSEISPFLPGKFPHCVKANKSILYLGPKHSETVRLLGESYRYISEIDDVVTISKLIEELYIKWKADNQSMALNRPDLVDYLSTKNLNEVMNSMPLNPSS